LRWIFWADKLILERKDMANLDRPQILLTNDDGIRSPGLWAAAEALSPLGFVTVSAPREQQSGSGRGMPSYSDGVIHEEQVVVGGKRWMVYAVGGTPAQTVQHGILELMPSKPDLVVAGINYGENVGIGVTISGTVGAALEGAANGCPALAVSLEVDVDHHLSYSTDVDFTTAAYFTQLFARKLLKGFKVDDVDVLKVDVPCDATKDTLWKVTRISRQQYFVPLKPKRAHLGEPTQLGYRRTEVTESMGPGSDAYAIHVERVVSVTPISLDLTSDVDLSNIEQTLKSKQKN
jgi:5'-nucleotidase